MAIYQPIDSEGHRRRLELYSPVDLESIGTIDCATHDDVRAALDERIASRLLAAEAAVTTARLAQRAGMAERVAECDAQLRGHVLAARRAQALREASEPGLARALTAVRDGLRDPNPTRTLVTDR